MSRDLPARSVWQTYSFRNIKNEIAHRLARLTRPTAVAPERSAAPAPYDDAHASSVGRFYDANHDAFMRVYGQVIQAFRTKDVRDLLDYQARSIGLGKGQRVLDAGCGVGAPAIHFAREAGVLVDAVTISERQFGAARQNVIDARLADKVNVLLGDYHRLVSCFGTGSFDVVYFLESFGHSRAKGRLIDECWEVLRPGGVLYIKDLFRRVPLRPEHARRIDHEIRRIDEAYHFEVGDLNVLLDQLRRRGFILSVVKSVDLDLDGFEDLAISNEFQELTGLAPITNWGEYVFPVDFYEVRCTKPEFSVEERLDRHFLQNRYHRREGVPTP